MAQNTSPFCNVTDYGAVGDGESDDTAAINAAIAAAAPTTTSPTGNTVYLPAGNYRLTGPLTVPAGLALEGAGWNTPGAEVNPFTGSWLFVAAGAQFSPVNITGGGGCVRRLGFNVTGQSTDAPPAPAAPMVHAHGQGNNAVIEDVCLYNPFAGIYVDGVGRVVLRRVFGQPFSYGIMVDGSQDSDYIEDVHFWPFWTRAGSVLGQWQRANGQAIVLLRCDNPHLSNIFALGYAVGLSLRSSASGPPHKVHLVNADFDYCVTGILVDAPGSPTSAATMQMANVTIQAPPLSTGAPAGPGIWVSAASSFAMVQASNVRVGGSGLNAVQVDGPNVRFYGENISLENWAGECGFAITSPTSFAWLGVGFAYTSGGNPYAPASQFHLARYA